MAKKGDMGVIYVGTAKYNKDTKKLEGKSIEIYELASLQQLNEPENNGKIKLVGRGKAISRVVDLALRLRRRKFVKIGKIEIDETPLKNNSGKEIFVSNISIEVIKK